MRQRFAPVCETVLDARFQIARDVAHQRGPEVAAHHVAPQRQGEPGLELPPLAQIGPQVEAAVAVRELTLVNQQSRGGPPLHHVVLDLIERHYDMADLGLVQLEREKRRGELTRDGDERAAAAERDPRVGWARSARDDAGPITVAEARTVRQQRIAIGEVGVGVQRDGRHFELAREGAAVQRLDVRELVDIAAVARVDLTSRERPEHEGIVRVRAVRQPDRAGRASGPAGGGRHSSSHW